MKFSRLFVLAVFLFVAACKKEPVPGGTGQFSFDLNGVHHSFSLVTINSGYAIYDTLGVKEKAIGIGTPGMIGGTTISFPMAVITISQNNALPCSDSLQVGRYPDALLNPACAGVAINGCIGFSFYYSDTSNAATGGLSTINTDSTGVLNITSFSMSPYIINGNFKCTVTDGNGNYYPVTNGLFTNIPFFIEQ